MSLKCAPTALALHVSWYISCVCMWQGHLTRCYKMILRRVDEIKVVEVLNYLYGFQKTWITRNIAVFSVCSD